MDSHVLCVCLKCKRPGVMQAVLKFCDFCALKLKVYQLLVSIWEGSDFFKHYVETGEGEQLVCQKLFDIRNQIVRGLTCLETMGSITRPRAPADAAWR